MHIRWLPDSDGWVIVCLTVLHQDRTFIMKQDTQESIKCRFQSPGAFADTDSFKILELSHLAGPPLSLPAPPPFRLSQGLPVSRCPFLSSPLWQSPDRRLCHGAARTFVAAASAPLMQKLLPPPFRLACADHGVVGHGVCVDLVQHSCAIKLPGLVGNGGPLLPSPTLSRWGASGPQTTRRLSHKRWTMET